MSATTNIIRALTPSAAAPTGPGLFARLLQALRDMRRRDQERQIASLIEAHGGRMTDAVERVIQRHFV